MERETGWKTEVVRTCSVCWGVGEGGLHPHPLSSFLYSCTHVLTLYLFSVPRRPLRQDSSPYSLFFHHKLLSSPSSASLPIYHFFTHIPLPPPSLPGPPPIHPHPALPLHPAFRSPYPLNPKHLNFLLILTLPSLPGLPSIAFPQSPALSARPPSFATEWLLSGQSVRCPLLCPKRQASRSTQPPTNISSCR